LVLQTTPKRPLEVRFDSQLVRRHAEDLTDRGADPALWSPQLGNSSGPATA
jgi:hypothetical protein